MTGKLELDDGILIGGKEKVRIVIRDHDAAWASRFYSEAVKIKEALGTTALGIEHVGSTSVPGLAAKPIVDILVMVRAPEDETTYSPQLTAAGYTLRVREPQFCEHRMFRTLARDVHVHIFAPRTEPVVAYRLLREWLKKSPEDRELYASTKRALARRDWDDMNRYTEAKTEVIQTILRHAREAHARGELKGIDD
jgi:GrpB-like predicted nucleotidyltransferase (UPF0157 family)